MKGKNMPSTKSRQRTNTKEKNIKSPRKKTFLLKLISAIICFLVLKYLSSFDWSDEFIFKVKEAVSYSFDFSKVEEFFQSTKSVFYNISKNIAEL